MIRILCHSCIRLTVLAGLWLCTLTPAQARNPEHLDEQFVTLSGMLSQGEIERGLMLLDLIVEAFEADALQVLGPGFGRFYYLKGMFLMADGRLEEASQQFEICYRVYANRGALAATRPNTFVDEALVRRISCLMSLDNVEEAAALVEYVNRAGLEQMSDQWALFINRGILLIQTGKADEGVAFFRSTLENDTNPAVTPSMRMEVVRLLALHWSDGASPEERREFVESVRPIVLNATEADRRAANPFFLEAASGAYEQKAFSSSLLWLSLFDVEAAVNAVESEAGGEDEKPEDSFDHKLLSGFLALTAGVHLQLGNPLGAVPAYEEVIERFPSHPNVADFRYQLVLSRLRIGDVATALRDIEILRNEMPGDSRVSELEVAVLEGLISQNQPGKALNLATTILARETRDAAAETAAYVLAIALFQLEKFESAGKAFSSYASTYGSGEYRQEALYYAAACAYQLSNPEAGLEALAQLVRDHGEGDLLSAALLLQAQLLAELERGEEALAAVQRIRTDFPDSPEAAEAGLMEGRILAATAATSGEALAAVEQALVAAERAGNLEAVREFRTEVLLLAAQKGYAERVAQTLDEIFADADRDVSRDPEFLVAARDAMMSLGRGQEILDRMETHLIRNGADRASPRLAELVQTYRDLVGEDSARLVSFSQSADLPPPLRAWLLLARIEDLPKDEQAERNRLFRELEQKVSREEMSTEVLARLAQWYEGRGDPATAAGIRSTALSDRKDEPGFERILIEFAKQEAESENPATRASAMNRFQQVLALSEDSGLREQARLGIARLHTRNADWKEAEAAWGQVLAERDWVAARAEANFEMARSLEEGGDPRKALGMYVSVYSNFTGQLDWSTQAYLRAARIMDAQGKRREALLILQDMLRRMHTIPHPGVDEAQRIFTQWKNEFIRTQ